MLAASGSRMCVSPALIDHQHGAAVTQVPYAQSRIEPGARCRARRSLPHHRRTTPSKANRATWRLVRRPELADMHAPPARAILTLRWAYSAFRTAGPPCRTEWSSRSVTPAASGLPGWDTTGQADRPRALAPDRASPVSGAPSSRGQRAAPGTPPIKVCANSFPLLRGVHSNPLRSRVRRFESCWGRCSNT